MNECKKRGPYLPVGDVEWECLTHDVELVRTHGRWGTPASREEMACPVGEPERKPMKVEEAES